LFITEIEKFGNGVLFKFLLGKRSGEVHAARAKSLRAKRSATSHSVIGFDPKFRVMALLSLFICVFVYAQACLLRNQFLRAAYVCFLVSTLHEHNPINFMGNPESLANIKHGVEI
jgi:hypothetical protein